MSGGRQSGQIGYVTGSMCRESCYSESEEELSLSWTHSKELKDSLVDMYKANPKVNEELKQRLPSPVRHQSSETKLPQLGSTDLGAILGTTSNQLVLEVLDKVPQYLRSVEEESRTSRSPSPQAHHRRSPSPQAHHRGPDAGRRMEEERASSRSPFTQDGYRSKGHIQGSNSSPPVYRRHIIPPDSSQALQSSMQEDQGNTQVSSSSFDSKKQSLVLDKEKNIAFLLKELDSLRDLNKKLQDKLAMREKELESRLVDAELMETQLDAQACEKAGALVEEIYQAQKDRDQAVMARLRLANEERDEALLRAKHLQQAVADLENINPEESDADLEELLNRVNSADSALGIERSGVVIVDRLQKARERRRKITAEEMNAVIEERETALARCKRLEQDLLQTREQSQTSANNLRQLTAENNQERSRKEDVEAVQRERDRALEHSQQLEEEIQTLRTYHSLHQAQCEAGTTSQRGQGASSLSSPSQTLQTKPLQPREAPSGLASPPQQQPLLAQLQRMASEHQNTQAQLQHSQEAAREANEKVQKLERLVEVLRKKVGTGSVRTVI
ncbi:mirror-image polydactyly gene 1 protein isoform X1 [Coregonus clupeaformis]|uniref:mirror-image polydactyly gene 1 protein isoform X1 n=2 Tax=Coregonus clupeaformis TaxID=59861 RepID=UPI001BE01A76|nr:mirror-image polydactyly gene 1 protein isoform X1 [Coregonus clupeaformis]